jgi:hypothetical protein
VPCHHISALIRSRNLALDSGTLQSGANRGSMMV